MHQPQIKKEPLIKDSVWAGLGALIACKELWHSFHKHWETSKCFCYHGSQVVIVFHSKWNPKSLNVFNRLKEIGENIHR